jgi:HSP20 family protein
MMKLSPFIFQNKVSHFRRCRFHNFSKYALSQNNLLSNNESEAIGQIPILFLQENQAAETLEGRVLNKSDSLQEADLVDSVICPAFVGKFRVPLSASSILFSSKKLFEPLSCKLNCVLTCKMENLPNPVNDQVLPLTIQDKLDHYMVEIEVPGLSKDDIKLSIKNNGNILLINAADDERRKNPTPHRVRMAAVALPRDTKIDRIKSDLGRGLLRVSIPKNNVTTTLMGDNNWNPIYHE